MSHILLLPLIWASHAGQWIQRHVLAPFQLGETAKNVTEDEIGVYGVLAYAVYKISRLVVDAWSIYHPAWLVGRIARGIALCAALIVSAWLITCTYIGLLIPVVDLDVSYTALLLAPVCAWIVLAYVMLAERVRERRAELEAQTGEGD